jgi:hypothetical protein
VTTNQQGLLQRLADSAAPGGIHAAIQFHMHVFAFQSGSDFHGSFPDQ